MSEPALDLASTVVDRWPEDDYTLVLLEEGEEEFSLQVEKSGHPPREVNGDKGAWGRRLKALLAERDTARQTAVEACAREVEAAGCSRAFPCTFVGGHIEHDRRCPIALAARLREMAR